ncbi:penicillin-binding protein [Gordoniibacillus kamchatkensis]|uniref:Penicillin-binding protein n=1 Tax=Gordoniibacillus kamchatkensis TaxID=1590651 RepID=A0ABR5AGC7_9BACL|nr:penicillin-binding protein [Paenibacillus sp. VKM B-2647]
MFLEREIAAGHIPGAVLHIAHKGGVLLHKAYGNRTVHPQVSPMNVDTVFDLASLTKVVAALPAALKLLEQGKIALSDTVDAFLPDFRQGQGEPIRILHLLTHTSGLAADLTDKKAVLKLSREELLARVIGSQPLRPPGEKVVYSDLGMILLYCIIETVTGEPFDAFVKREIFEPLDMNDTGFCPSFEPERYAATEYSEELGGYKLGIVHDEKAERLGGVSGHAGLFSTAADLANFVSVFRQGGVYRGRKLFSEATVALSTRNFTPYDREYRGLGWLLKNPADISSGGDLLSSRSFGHTGFTGTSLWLDPEVDLQIILLTNRVHFGRTDHILRLRPRLHNLIRSMF